MLKDEIIAYSKSIGIDHIGFTTADPFEEMKTRLAKQQEKGYASGFEEPDLEKRTAPKLLMQDAKSIIAIAIAYPSKMTNTPRMEKDNYRGVFAKASWGLDYHIVLKEKLNLLEEYILSKVPDAVCQSMVDTGELVDRAVAERAGIGWSGKNCSIISPVLGSFMYLGEMITNIVFEPDLPIDNQCGECRKCLDACPTGALVGEGQINAKACISYLTQTKEVIPQEYIKKIGNRLYGCDTCQVVCPINKGIDFHLHPEIEPEGELVKPLLKPILSLSNRAFKEKFGHMAGAWRGKTPLQRNAILALAHFKDQSALGELQRIAEIDTREVIRETAKYAVNKIKGDNI
ncbi:MAG: putative Fe-S protein [Bacillales bacterium]|jgi:epoxyqueuosine reductase|nr:putative Fe-S protein [Bacillales bacterium]